MTRDSTLRRAGDPREAGSAREFADALTEVRLRAGLSIRDVARATGIPSGTLGGYFSGRHLPPATQPRLLGQVLDALHVSDPHEVQQWREALLRARRAGQAPAVDDLHEVTPATGLCPYRGLEPFAEVDAPLFFGREQIVDDLAAEVERRATDPGGPRILIVVGPSGSGKSSVLHAGLIPRLRGSAATAWAVAALVPGTDPLGALAAARSAVADAPRALLVVDQAEEVFSPEVTPQERADFVHALVATADPAESHGRTTVVVVGLRADFYGQAAADPDILPALRSSQVLLGSMPLADLRRAIVAPVEALGVQVEPALVELLLRDLSPRGQVQSGYDAGALPLVSHALLATWEHHRGDHLTVADYLAAGGIAGAVQQSAEQVFASLDEPGQAAAQWLFAQLVTVDDDAVMTRRRVSHDELHHPDRSTDLALDAVIEAFVSGRLLTAGEGTLEVSHEALLGAWPRLSDWVRTDLDSTRLQRRISDAAALWRERDRDSALVLRGSLLADAQQLAARPRTSPRTLSSAEQEYLAASTAVEQAERAAERRQTHRLSGLVAVLATLALLAGLLAGLAVRSANEARTQQQAATLARDEATSRQLAIAADDLRRADPALAAQLALAAYRVTPTLQARSSLLTSTGTPTPTRFVGPAGDMHATASPDGTVLAISGVDGVTRLWRRSDPGGEPDADAGTEPATRTGTGTGDFAPAGELPAAGDPAPVYASAFSPDGALLAIGSSSDGATLWNVADLSAPRQVGAPAQVPGAIYSLAFSPDGRQLTAGTSEPAVRRWAVPDGTSEAADAQAPTELASITAEFGGNVQSVAHHPDGTLLATGSADGAVRIWSTPTRGTPTLVSTARAGEPADFVYGVAFSPDGTLLAAGGKDRMVRIWDVRDPKAPAARGEPMGSFTSWVNTVAFSPDGATLAAGSSDGQVASFAVADGTPRHTLPNPAAITSVQFVGSGSALLTSEVDGVARLWPLPGPVLSGFTDTVWSVLQDADETVLGVGPGSRDGAVHLFDRSDDGELSPGPVLTPPAQAGPGDGAAALSADGRWVAAGTATGRVALWARTPESGEVELVEVVTVSDKLVEAVAFSPDSRLLAGIADDGAVVVWTLARGAAAQPAHQLRTAGLPLGLAFSSDSAILAVGSSNDEVNLWDLSGSQARALPTLTGFDNYVYGLAFEPGGRLLATGSTDRTVRIWDLRDPADPLPVGAPIRGPGDTAYALSWATDASGDRATLAVAAKDGFVWLWDVTDPGAPIATATLGSGGASFHTVALGADATQVSAAGSDQVVVTWSTDAERVATGTCATTGSPMTEAEWARLAAGVEFPAPCGSGPGPGSPAP